MWVSIASDAACAAALQHAVQVYGIHDTETLQTVLEYDATGFARALCSALQAEAPSRSSTGTQTDAAILMVETGTQTVADDVVDVSSYQLLRRWLLRRCAWLMKHSIVSDSLTSVLAHGKLGQSSLQLSSMLQRSG